MAAESGRYDGFVAIGVVIRGETYHFEVVSNESARGLMALSMDGLAIGNGILTVEDEAQALARARMAEKDKGGEAAKASIAMFEIGQRFAGYSGFTDEILTCTGWRVHYIWGQPDYGPNRYAHTSL